MYNLIHTHTHSQARSHAYISNVLKWMWARCVPKQNIHTHTQRERKTYAHAFINKQRVLGTTHALYRVSLPGHRAITCLLSLPLPQPGPNPSVIAAWKLRDDCITVAAEGGGGVEVQIRKSKVIAYLSALNNRLKAARSKLNRFATSLKQKNWS